MKYRLILVLLILCGLSVVRAQDDEPEYRLREPDLKRFAETAPEAIQAWNDELPIYYAKVPHIPMTDILIYETTFGYSYEALFQQDFETLSNLYNAVSSIYSSFAMENFSDYDWMMPLFQAWLRDNPSVDLSKQTSYEIPGFNIETRAVDFDGDGMAEYAVDLSFGGIEKFLVLKKNASLKEGYDISSLWGDNSFTPNDFDTVTSGEVSDFNGDGLPEWVMYEEHKGYYEYCQYFRIFGWSDGHIQNLIADQPKTDCLAGDMEFINLDGDLAKEIRQINPNSGDGENWGCHATTTVIWDWDGTSYHLTQEQTDQAATLGCAMKEAESLVWDGEIEKAIPIYEQGLQQQWNGNYPDYFDSTERNEMTQYAKVRLAVAYALVGRYEDAGHLISELKSETPQSEMMATLIKQLSNVPVTDVSLCSAAYNVFWEYRHSMVGYHLPSNIVVGRNHFVCCVGDNAPPQPEQAGCDAPRLIDQTLSKKRFTVDQSPVGQVTSMGVNVESSFHADLNSDGKDEWLIWPIAKVAPILFVPDKDTYVLSRPDVRRPNQYSQLETHSLPQGEIGLVDWVYLYPYVTNMEAGYYDVRDAGSALCKETQQGVLGSVLLWQLKGTALKPIPEIPLCEKRPISELFQNDNLEINGWSYRLSYDHSANFAPTVFRWESLSHSYKPPMQIAFTSTNNPHEDTTPLPAYFGEADLFNEMGTITDKMGQKQYTEALERIDNALAHHVPDALALLTNGLHYYRGITLEALKRPDEALTEYVMIYKDAPQSAWGKLAALHLECVTSCG